MKETWEVIAENEVLSAYKKYVANAKRHGAPEYMVTPEEFARRMVKVIWAEIGKGKEQRGGK